MKVEETLRKLYEDGYSPHSTIPRKMLLGASTALLKRIWLNYLKLRTCLDIILEVLFAIFSTISKPFMAGITASAYIATLSFAN